MQYFLKAEKVTSYLHFKDRNSLTAKIASDPPQNEANRDHLINYDATYNKKTASTILKVEGDS